MDPKPVKQNKKKYKKKVIISQVIRPVIIPNINIIIAKPIELIIDFCNDLWLLYLFDVHMIVGYGTIL